jgi:hypothetical protein
MVILKARFHRAPIVRPEKLRQGPGQGEVSDAAAGVVCVVIIHSVQVNPRRSHRIHQINLNIKLKKQKIFFTLRPQTFLLSESLSSYENQFVSKAA